MIKTVIPLFISLLLYISIITPFTHYMKNKPIEEKLGYVPTVSVLKSVAVDQKEMLGASLVLKVMMHFGGQMDVASSKKIATAPDFRSMSRILHGAVKLDPYNIDAYYFANAFLTWDVKQYKIANELLDYGMKYRTWDWYLPFFAGFNSAYFMHDYPKAAEYYKKAGDLSGQDLHKSLAGRYMQESGQTELAIGYLTAIAKSERNQSMKKSYEIRIASFKEVRKIELARDRFLAEKKRLPTSLDELITNRYISQMPKDPYGGEFYISPEGKVSSTSRFSFSANNDSKN